MEDESMIQVSALCAFQISIPKVPPMLSNFLSNGYFPFLQVN